MGQEINEQDSSRSHYDKVEGLIRQRLHYMPWSMDDQRVNGTGYKIRLRYDDTQVTREPIVAEDEWELYGQDGKLVGSGHRLYVTAYSGMNEDGTYSEMSTTFAVDEGSGNIAVRQNILAQEVTPALVLDKLYGIHEATINAKWEALEDVLQDKTYGVNAWSAAIKQAS